MLLLLLLVENVVWTVPQPPPTASSPRVLGALCPAATSCPLISHPDIAHNTTRDDNGFETPEPIHPKFGMFDYVNRQPHTQNKVAAANGLGSFRVFFSFFEFLNGCTAHTEKRGFSLNALKNVLRWMMCSFGDWGVLPRDQIFPFYP